MCHRVHKQRRPLPPSTTVTAGAFSRSLGASSCALLILYHPLYQAGGFGRMG